MYMPHFLHSFTYWWALFYVISTPWLGDTVVKNPPAISGDAGDGGFIPGLGRSPGGENGKPFPVFLPGKFHGQRSLAGSQGVIYDWVHTHGCSQLLAIVNNAALNLGVHISLQNLIFSYFGYISRSRTDRLYANCTFNFLRKLHIIFYSGCNILHSHCLRVPVFLHSHQHLLTIFLTVAISMGVRYHLTVVLIFISLMLSIFSYSHWPFVCLLWRNVFSRPLFLNQSLFLSL